MADREQVRHMTADDVAERLSLPRWSIYELVRSGDLPHLRIGRRVRFREQDIEAWEESKVSGELQRAKVEEGLGLGFRGWLPSAQ